MLLIYIRSCLTLNASQIMNHMCLVCLDPKILKHAQRSLAEESLGAVQSM